jgi:hypothetical protein
MNKKTTQQDTVEESQLTAKLPYAKPSLVELGKVANLTMGSQPGTGESGNPNVYCPRGGNTCF